MTPHINLISGPPRVRLQSVLDHQFRIEFPSTGKKRDPSIPGARKDFLVRLEFLSYELVCSYANYVSTWTIVHVGANYLNCLGCDISPMCNMHTLA